MRSLVNHLLQPWLFSSALFCCVVITFGDSGEKKMNLRIGFDLTQGENGAPSLRIRDFEDSSEFNQRAAEDEVVEIKKKSPSVRADSFSGSSETGVTNNAAARMGSSKEEDRSRSNSDDSGDDSDNKNRYSTRGLQPDEYEPEENVKIHERFQDSSGSDSDRPLNRGKRNINLSFARRF